MPVKAGTLSITDLLEVRDTVVQFGTDRIAEALQADLEEHNAIVEDMRTELAIPTEERAERYGTNDAGEFEELDENGKPRAQKVTVGGEVAYPLRKFGRAVGWTRDYMETRTVRDMALQQLDVERGHVVRIGQDYKRALFVATNFTFRDFHVDQQDLPVKRLLNADSAEIPNGPFGVEFDPATHSHYDAIDWAAATEAQRVAAVDALMSDVTEHGHTLDVRIYINVGNESQFRALPGFVGYHDPRIRPATTEESTIVTLDVTKTDNRPIGVYNGAEVWTKPWVPFNYQYCFASGDPRKPLKFREPKNRRKGLYLASNMVEYPLYAEFFEAWFGIGVFTRTNGAVLYMGGGTYTNPTF